MSDPKALQELVQTEWIEAQIASTDEDADAADEEYRRLVGHAEVRRFGDAALKAYKADAKRLDTERGEFNGAFTLAANGRGNSAKLASAYERYVQSLSALEAQNRRHAALADTRIATIAAAVAALLLAMFKNGQKKAAELEKDLKALVVDLKTAEDAVEGAKLQRIINTCISAATLLLGPAGWTARVIMAGSSVTAQLVVDYALGPSKGGADSASVTVLGGAAEGVEKLGNAGRKFVSAGTAVISFGFDSKEVGDAEDILKQVQRDLKKTLVAYNRLIELLEPLARQARTLQVGLDKALAAAKSAQDESAEAKREYEELIEALGSDA